MIPKTDDIERLRRDCDMAWSNWLRLTGALQLVVLRDMGVEELLRLKPVVIGQHQGAHYVDGLRKLGIHDDPPALGAAKYHYFSNIIGGLNVAYMEESPKKAWIRYHHPMEFYHGSGLMAFPAAVQRAVFRFWHARNGERVGCPRLGYVCTKLMQQGEPYDEGYFIEYDRDIGPDEALRFEAVTNTPEFDPAKAPVLDPAIWPEERILRARRKYAGAYLKTYITALWNLFGLAPACHLVAQTMSLAAIQNVDELRARMGIAGTGLADAARFLDHLLGVRGDDYSVEMIGSSKCRIVLRSYRPLDDAAVEELRHACFAFPSTCVRLMNGHIRMTRHMEADKGARDVEVWELEDTGRWLY
jgi:hypothetical protein